MMTDEEAIAAFGALAHTIRFAVWRLLGPYGTAGLPAGVIGDHVGVSPSGLSFHLRIMVEARLLNVQRSRRNFIYAVDANLPASLARTLLGKIYSEIQPDVVETAPEIMCALAPEVVRLSDMTS